MRFEVKHPDPFNILSSTKAIVENSRFVFINENKIEEISGKILERFNKGLDAYEIGLSTTGSLENDVQLVFIEDVVNFCFWARKDEEKWQVEKNGKFTEGGWYGLHACFKRGIAEGRPILDAKFLSSFSVQDARNFFRGKNNIEIPLLKERVENLQEAGFVLLEKFGGKFLNAVIQANYDAVNLVKIIIDNFPSFKDISIFDGNEIIFLKRAQICPNDINYVLKAYNKTFVNLDKLTAFADYKLPQILRTLGIINYSRDLSEKVDSYIEISQGSQEEIEIRSATVWAVELIRQKLNNLTAGNIDNTLWLMSQGAKEEAKPYHRTRTIFY